MTLPIIAGGCDKIIDQEGLDYICQIIQLQLITRNKVMTLLRENKRKTETLLRENERKTEKLKQLKKAGKVLTKFISNAPAEIRHNMGKDPNGKIALKSGRALKMILHKHRHTFQSIGVLVPGEYGQEEETNPAPGNV